MAARIFGRRRLQLAVQLALAFRQLLWNHDLRHRVEIALKIGRQYLDTSRRKRSANNEVRADWSDAVNGLAPFFKANPAMAK